MERIKSLNVYQKILLIILIASTVIFTVVFMVRHSREGFEYHNAILVLSEENGSTLYSGRLKDVPAVFTVTPDKTVEFRYGDKSFGPYYLKEDPTAISQRIAETFAGATIEGFELYRADEMLFRGCRIVVGSESLLFDEDGNDPFEIQISAGPGVSVYDEEGNEMDPMEPDIYSIIALMDGPALTRKGNVRGWLFGILFTVFALLTMLYADEIFRWQMRFKVADPEKVEPAGLEIASRYITWTMFTVLALAMYIWGVS